MPWTSADARIKSLPKEGRNLWVKVANGYLADHPGEDISAIRIAWAAVAKAGYSKDEHKWNLAGTKESVGEFEKNVYPFGGAPMLLFKAYTKEGKHFIVAKASGLKVDRQDERMDQSAIDDMVTACKAGNVDLLDNHYSSFEMGKSTDASVNDEGELEVKFQMDMSHPNSAQLYKEIEDGKCTRQLSVGGNVTKARYEYHDGLGKAVKVLEHVDLDHIAVTREGHSAYPDAAFVGAIAKQVHLRDTRGLGGDRMELLKQLLETLKKAAVEATAVQKAAFQLTPEMWEEKDGVVVLKAEFSKQLKDAKVTVSKEELAEVAKSLETILKAFGIPTVKKQEDGAAAPPVPGPGTEAPKDGDGSVEETTEEETKPAEDGAVGKATVKTTAKALVEALRKDLEGKLEIASKNLEEIKKDAHVTKEQLLKATLEASGLKKELEVLKAQPAAPRPGSGVKIVKAEEASDGRAVSAITKTMTEGPNSFMVKLETEVNALSKQRNTKAWNETLAKEAVKKAEMLKSCKTIGPEATMELYGIAE